MDLEILFVSPAAAAAASATSAAAVASVLASRDRYPSYRECATEQKKNTPHAQRRGSWNCTYCDGVCPCRGSAWFACRRKVSLCFPRDIVTYTKMQMDFTCLRPAAGRCVLCRSSMAGGLCRSESFSNSSSLYVSSNNSAAVDSDTCFQKMPQPHGGIQWPRGERTFNNRLILRC